MVLIDQPASLVEVQIVSQRALDGQRHRLDARVDHHIERVDQADQQARQDAGGEQRDRRLLRRQRIEDHRDRRRDDDGDGARRGDQPDREALVVAVLAQRRIKHAADRDDGADRGVRHRAEHLGRRDRRDRERAAHAADQRHHPDHHPARDAALRHDLAGQHEERHRQQREVVEPAEQEGLDGLGRNVGDEQDDDQAGHQQHEKDRHARERAARRAGRSRRETADMVLLPALASVPLNDPVCRRRRGRRR